MKLKKLLAAVTAAALAVSTMAVSSFTASAAALATVPEGTREVIAAAEVDYAPTTNWDNGPWAQIAVDESVMTEENVYVEAKFSGLGGADTDDGEAPFDDVKSWATILKWYNNNKIEGTEELDTAQNFEVEFKACEGGTADECFAYAPISDFKRASWGAICGNLQSGHIKGFTLESLSIVKFTASSEDDDLPKNEWYETESGHDAYYTTVDGGGIPDNIASRQLVLDEGKTLNDVAKVTVSGFVEAKNNATVGASGFFGLADNSEFIADQSTDWLLESEADEFSFDWENDMEDISSTAYIAFDIASLNQYNVIGVMFEVEYKENGGDVEVPEGKKITLEENSWGEGGPDNTNWQGMDSVAIEGITNWTTTATEAMEKLDSLEFSFPVNGAISNGQVFDVSKLSFQGVLQTSDGCWKTFDGSVAGGKVTISIPDIDSSLADYTGSVNIAVVVNTAYSNSSNEIDVYIGDVTVKTGSDEPAPPVDPDGEVLFSGNAAANTSVSGSKVSKYKDDAVITVKYMPAATEAEFIEAAQITAEEMEYPANTGTIAGQLDADPWWCQPAESAYWSVASSEAFGNEQTFTITVADYLASINRTELPYELVFCPWNGTAITKVTIKGDLKSSEPDDPKPDDPKPDDPKPEDPKPDNTVTTPSDRVTYPVVIPFGYTPATDEEITNAVSSTAEGDTASVNLTGNTRVEKSVLDTITGKDINVEFKLKGGVKWIINGKNVEKAKKVDLGVRLRSKNIPAEKISEVAGENKTVQFSLRHNGDFGFTGALIMPFSSAYNGKFANLYYYNKAKDELEFIGSSKISAGQASFVFTHASDYVVVIDDEAYGEDVSSAAGVYEASEETTAPYVAAVAVIAVFGAAAVVIKKRLAK